MSFLNTKQAAEYCQVTRRTLYNWIKRGLRCYKPTGKELRFLKSDLDSFIRSESPKGFFQNLFNAKRTKNIVKTN